MLLFGKYFPWFPWHCCSHDSSLIILIVLSVYPPEGTSSFTCTTFMNHLIGFCCASLSILLHFIQGQDSNSTINFLTLIRNILSTSHLLCLSKLTPQFASLFLCTDTSLSAPSQHRQNTGLTLSIIASVSFLPLQATDFQDS